MTNQPTNANVGASTGAPKLQEQTPGVGAKQALLTDIRMKWDKFTDQQLGDLKNNDDLVAHVVAKYDHDKAQAQRDVDTLRARRNS
jgi:hypothetical protein